MILPVVLTAMGIAAAVVLGIYVNSKLRKTKPVDSDDYDVENYDLVTSRPMIRKPKKMAATGV